MIVLNLNFKLTIAAFKSLFFKFLNKNYCKIKKKNWFIHITITYINGRYKIVFVETLNRSISHLVETGFAALSKNEITKELYTALLLL